MAQLKPTPVVIDCDPGNDDAWAIISLLKCEERCNVKLLGVSIVNGNTSVEHGCRNALMVLEALGRTDVPVFAGLKSSLLIRPGYYPTFHGVDGFCDIYKDKPSLDLVQKKHAVEALKELIDENPNEIVVFAVGPMGNIALLFKMYPGISKKIKSLWLMGGNYQGIGNTTKTAEFNFSCDPESAHIMLTEAECPIYIYPWEACLQASRATPTEWRNKVLPRKGDPVTKLMDPVDEHISVKGNFILCDVYAIACFLFPQLIRKMEKCHVTVELGGAHSRGQMVVDHLEKEEPNAFVIQEMDGETFASFIMWLCGHENSNF